MVKMILIGGTGRSGTSIVKEILANHHDASSLPFEYRFIIDPDGLVDFYTSYTAAWSPYMADRRLKRLERLLNDLAREPLYHRVLGRLIRWSNPSGRILTPRAYHGWKLKRHLPNYESHVQNLMSRLVEFSFSASWVGTESYQLFPRMHHAAPKTKGELAQVLGDFVRDVIGDLLRETGAKFFVEDNTWNIFFAREIMAMLPEAKLIHVYRDPRDVVASFSQQRWCPTRKDQSAYWYRAMMVYWFEVRANLPRGSYYELRLEDLVANPQVELRAVCKFADIPFSEAMLEIDLGHSHSGRWKKEYSHEESVLVGDILGDILDELGYD